MNGPYNINSVSQATQSKPSYNELSSSALKTSTKIFTPADFGILGNGTDEKTKLQTMFNAAVGGVVILPTGMTISFNGQVIVPRRVVIAGNGASLSRLTPSLTHSIKLLGDTTISNLNIPTLGGALNDKGMLITGSNVELNNVTMMADSEGTVSNTSWAIEIDAGGSTFVDNIKLNSMKFAKWKTCIFAKRCTRLIINDIDVNTYRLAIYLVDVKRSRINGGRIYGLTTTSTGGPGENGLLVESSVTNGTDDLKVQDVTVEDSCEHGYRLGGQATMSNIKFVDCISIRPGRSINVGYSGATEWHGGSGFKALGATTVVGQWHKNVKFIRCITEDCSTQTGTFPAGHGVNNFSAFNIFCCEDVQLIDCKARKSSGATYSSLQACIIGACTNVYIRNFECDDTPRACLVLHDEPVPTGYPGWQFGITGLTVFGGKMKCNTQGSPVISMAYCNYAQTDWKFIDIDCRGGASMIRLETPGTGSYGDDFFVSGNYQDSSVDDSISTSPIIQGVGAFRADVSGPWRPASYGASVKDGSKFVDTLTGATRIRKAGIWIVL